MSERVAQPRPSGQLKIAAWMMPISQEFINALSIHNAIASAAQQTIHSQSTPERSSWHNWQTRDRREIRSRIL
jgi:hypothetical protein